MRALVCIVAWAASLGCGQSEDPSFAPTGAQDPDSNDSVEQDDDAERSDESESTGDGDGEPSEDEETDASTGSDQGSSDNSGPAMGRFDPDEVYWVGPAQPGIAGSWLVTQVEPDDEYYAGFSEDGVNRTGVALAVVRPKDGRILYVHDASLEDPSIYAFTPDRRSPYPDNPLGNDPETLTNCRPSAIWIAPTGDSPLYACPLGTAYDAARGAMLELPEDWFLRHVGYDDLMLLQDVESHWAVLDATGTLHTVELDSDMVLRAPRARADGFWLLGYSKDDRGDPATFSRFHIDTQGALEKEGDFPMPSDAPLFPDTCVLDGRGDAVCSWSMAACGGCTKDYGTVRAVLGASSTEEIYTYTQSQPGAIRGFLFTGP